MNRARPMAARLITNTKQEEETKLDRSPAPCQEWGTSRSASDGGGKKFDLDNF